MAALIRSGEVSSREVIDAHLARIEAVNPERNAVTVMLRTSAREAADAANAQRKKAGKRDLPPLHGVPITVKENVDCVGTPTTLGLAANAKALPERDAPVVERMRAAAGYEVEEAIPPEIELINHLWTQFEMSGLSLTAEPVRSKLSAEAAMLMDALIARIDPSVTHAALHQERSRLGRAWSAFFAQYPIMLGPVWPSAPFVHDADVASPAGSDLMLSMQWFVTPGNLLGFPASRLPGFPASRLPCYRPGRSTAHR